MPQQVACSKPIEGVEAKTNRKRKETFKVERRKKENENEIKIIDNFHIICCLVLLT